MPDLLTFDAPDYAAFVSGFRSRLRQGPLCIVFSGPSARQRGAALAELSDQAQLPLHVVPLETRVADRAPVMLANLREDFDAAGSGSALLCFRHADVFIARALEAQAGAANLPPLDYIFERARRFKGAVVLSLDDSTHEHLIEGRGDVWIRFPAETDA
jgi:hypothetical protein